MVKKQKTNKVIWLTNKKTSMDHFLEQQQKRKTIRDQQDAQASDRVNSIIDSLMNNKKDRR